MWPEHLLSLLLGTNIRFLGHSLRTPRHQHSIRASCSTHLTTSTITKQPRYRNTTQVHLWSVSTKRFDSTDFSLRTTSNFMSKYSRSVDHTAKAQVQIPKTEHSRFPLTFCSAATALKDLSEYQCNAISRGARADPRRRGGRALPSRAMLLWKVLTPSLPQHFRSLTDHFATTPCRSGGSPTARASTGPHYPLS
jgi:hypothetical protein